MKIEFDCDCVIPLLLDREEELSQELKKASEDELTRLKVLTQEAINQKISERRRANAS